MKVAVVLLAVLVAAYAAPAHEQQKKFIISTIKDALHSIGHAFSSLWHAAKDEFNKITGGLHLNFDSVVGKLVGLIDSDTTEHGCQSACTGGAATLLGPLAHLADSLCGPACKGRPC